MKRKWNWRLWLGCAVALLGVFSYTWLAQFPITRDFPWVNLLLFCAGGILLGTGLVRAYNQPQIYRGKIVGPVLAAISLFFVSLFAYEIFYVLRQVPRSAHAPRLGEKAPEFALPDQSGKRVSLAELISPNGAILIFYRGHW
jgi:AhpC/TSA family